jgi:PAS domain S-box-containing protein
MKSSENNDPALLKQIGDLQRQVSDLKAALSDSEDKFRRLTDSAPVGIYFNDAQGRSIYINEKCAELVGVPADKALNFDWIPYLHPDDRERMVSEWEHAFNNSAEFHSEYRWVHEDGKIVWTLGEVIPILGPDGKATMYIGTLTDITERKQSEQKLVENEEKFRALADTSPLAIYASSGIEQVAEYINPAFVKLFGYTIDEVPTVSQWWPLAYPDETYRNRIAREWQQKVERALATNSEIEQIETIVTCKDGSTKNISWGFSAVGKQNWAMGLDLTERVLAAKEMEKQKTTFEALFESIPDATVLADPQRRIIAINRAFTEIFGYTLDEIVGKPTSVFYESEEEFLRQGRLRYNLSSEKATEPYVVTYKRKDGILFPGETVGTKVFTPDGTLLGFFGLMRDITDKLRQEEAHRQTQKMEAIGTLSSGVAHEYNNLLAIISGNIDLVQHKQKTGIDPEEHIENIKETVSRAKSIVAQILTFSRQEKQKLTTVDLSVVVADALKFLRATMPASVEIIKADDGSVFVNADTTQLHQVLINLSNNAVHAMDEKGRLTIHLGKVALTSSDLPARLEGQPGFYATLSVSDTGCGIKKEDMRRIFDPFFTTKNIGVGTGLGLSVVHGIVEQHDGFITVDSAPGQGTTFTIFLPVLDADPPESMDVSEDSLLTGTERILFVDDEECLAETFCELLQYQGYTVTSITRCEEALELFKATPDGFDLVITDQTMPNMTGVELATELLKISPQLPIILCSGYAAEVSEHEAKGIGIRAFCLKPIGIEQLATVIRKVLAENDAHSGSDLVS